MQSSYNTKKVITIPLTRQGLHCPCILGNTIVTTSYDCSAICSSTSASIYDLTWTSLSSIFFPPPFALIYFFSRKTMYREISPSNFVQVFNKVPIVTYDDPLTICYITCCEVCPNFDLLKDKSFFNHHSIGNPPWWHDGSFSFWFSWTTSSRTYSIPFFWTLVVPSLGLKFCVVFFPHSP